MKKLVTVLILLLLAGAGGYAYYKYGKPEDKPVVLQAQVLSGDVTQMVQASGTLEALRTVAVGSQVSGTVSDLAVDFNSIVKKGEVIAKLDPSLLQVQVDIGKANIEKQQSDIDSQKVQLENDQVNLKRTQGQFDKGLVSPQQLEAAQLQVKVRAASINSLQKQLVQNQANLAQAQLNVSYCTIVSPIDGVVVDRKVDVGQVVQQSVNVATFFTIATDLTTLKLTAGVDEADIGYIRPHMRVTFTVDGYPNQTFTGSVSQVRLNAQTQNNVVTYPVWIDVQNTDLKLRPSMTATARIIVDSASGVVKVPNQALRFRPTSDMYTWLGMTPPAAGAGRARGANAAADTGGPGGRGGANANSTGGAPGADALAANGGRGRGANGQPDLQANAGGNTTRQPRDQGQGGRGQGGQGFGPGQGQGGQGQNRQDRQGQGGQNAQDAGGRGGGRSGRGFGAQGIGNMTPDQLARFQQQFGGRGGRGGGRGNRTQPNDVASAVSPTAGGGGEKIDDLFAPVQKRIQPGQVWVYDDKAADPNKKLKQISVRLGLTDGQFSEIVAGDVQPGQQVVTGVTPPPSALPKPGTATNSIFQQPNQRGGGGFGGPGGGGFGGPGGGGGGGGGGRGGGN